MGYVKRLWEEHQYREEESVCRAPGYSSLLSRVEETLMVNGFEESEAASLAKSLVAQNRNTAVALAKEMYP